MKGTIRNGIYHKYEKEKSRLRKIGKPYGSWTINLDWLKDKEINLIIYETKIAIYKLTYKDALAKGIIHSYQGETKLIVPIILWEITKKTKKEEK